MFAIGLDIDKTLTTGNPSAIHRLRRFSEDNSVPLYVNTARSAIYCDQLLHTEHDVTTHIVKKENHYCRPLYGDAVEFKRRNMQSMCEREGLNKNRCILVDDKAENIDGVVGCGYVGFKVDPKTGITDKVVDDIIRYVDANES